MSPPAGRPGAAAREAVVLLVGNPNSGKTTLFNALTGMTARVGNYPGITVEHREGVLTTPDGRRVRIIDLPGTYSLVPRADDEVVAVRGALGRLPLRTADGEGRAAQKPDLIVAVVDATSLDRNLYLVAQLREAALPIVVALTMMDTVQQDGATIDTAALAQRLFVPVVPTMAARAGGAAELTALLAAAALPGTAPALPLPTEIPSAMSPSLTALGDAIAADLAVPTTPAQSAAHAVWALSCARAGTLQKLSLDDRVVQRVLATTGDDVDRLVERVVVARWDLVAQWTKDLVVRPAARSLAKSVVRTNRVDAIALHPVLGPVVLVLVFFTLFQALFTWSQPVMDAIEVVITALRDVVRDVVPASLPLLRSLLADGVVAGVGNVVVFVPQIAVLFLFLGLLEDSGYLARAAFLLDKLMAKVGLHGRAFVPMLSGFACAVPAIMATRTIESEKDRIVTILVTPLVSCSARLPVYALMIATVFSTLPPVFGFISPGAIVMIAMYSLSLVAAVAMAGLFKRTLLKSPIPPLVLELPPYRMPRGRDLVRQVSSRVRVFLVEAGTVILAITVVLWGLFTFPRMDGLPERVAAEKARVAAHGGDDEALADVDARAAKEQLDQSIAGRLGHGLEPLIRPLGFDWKIGVGLVASFAAREVLVSTLGLVYGLGDATDEDSPSLREAMRADVDETTGKPVYTPLTGLSLMVFFVLAMQCMSTLAAVKRETRSWRWPVFQFTYMSVLAYLGSLLVYQGGKLLGFS